MTTKLEGLEIERVDFVDKGANPGAHITLFKRDTSMAEKDVKTEPEATDAVAKRVADLEKRAADAEAKAKEATEQVAKANEQNTKAAERIAKLEEEREHRDSVAKVSKFSAIAKADDFAPIYRKIHKTLDDKEREWFDKWLDGLNSVAKNSALFKELGVGGSAESGSAYDKLEKMARELIAKSKDKVTFEQAFAEACDSPEGQKLYSEYLKETA